MVGGGDCDGVDVFVRENATHVRLELRPFPGLLKDGGGRGFGAATVNIDDRGDFDVGHREDFTDMRGAPRANAYDSEANAIIGSRPGLLSGSGASDEKMTAVHILIKNSVTSLPRRAFAYLIGMIHEARLL
jgi:hypothetical protein